MKILGYLCLVLHGACLHAAVLYSHEYHITDIGEIDEVVFSTDIHLGPVSSLSAVEIEMSNSYVAEFALMLRSPDGQLFRLLNHSGLRTRVGAGNGLLVGVELYTLVNPSEAALSVMDWNFSGYRHGGIYGANEWPVGSWEAGTWNLSLFNDDMSSASNGVIGTVRITGTPVPELSVFSLACAGMMLGALRHNRT